MKIKTKNKTFVHFVFLEQLLLKPVDLMFFGCWSLSAQRAAALPQAISSLLEPRWKQHYSS